MFEKKKILSFFKRRKVNVFLIFLVLALLFSLLTKLSKDYTQTISFNIKPVNIPEDKLIVNDSSYILKIDLRTYGFKLLRYNFTKPTLNINIENLDKNETHFIWTEKKAFSEIVSQFDPNVSVENINPDTLRIRYDTNSVKMVPVILIEDINFKNGFDIVNDFVIEPDSVKLIGPGVLIDTLNAVYTEPILLNEVKFDISQSVNIELVPNDQVRFSHENVTLNGDVEKFTEGSIDVPVIVKNIPENINFKIFPKTVPVVFYSSLSNFKTISQNNFIIECDYNSIQENRTYLIPQIIEQPKNIKSAKLGVNKVEFIITQ